MLYAVEAKSLAQYCIGYEAIHAIICGPLTTLKYRAAVWKSLHYAKLAVRHHVDPLLGLAK